MSHAAETVMKKKPQQKQAKNKYYIYRIVQGIPKISFIPQKMAPYKITLCRAGLSVPKTCDRDRQTARRLEL